MCVLTMCSPVFPASFRAQGRSAVARISSITSGRWPGNSRRQLFRRQLLARGSAPDRTSGGVWGDRDLASAP